MKYFFAFLFITSVFLGNAQGIEENNAFKHTHSAGLTVLKTLPVFGIGYRYETKKRFLFDLDFGISSKLGPKVITQHTKYWGLTEISIIYEIGKPSRTDFYIYSANGLIKKTHSYLNTTNERKENTELHINNSLGVGVEFLILKQLGFNLSMYVDIFDKYFGDNGGAHLAIYYKF